jgi:hypothetical protein
MTLEQIQAFWKAVEDARDRNGKRYTVGNET